MTDPENDGKQQDEEPSGSYGLVRIAASARSSLSESEAFEKFGQSCGR